MSTSTFSYTHTHKGKRGLVLGLINNLMPDDMLAYVGHFFCGWVDGCKCDVISAAVFLRWVLIRFPPCSLYGQTTYLKVWFSVSKRDIYGFGSAVPCVWCKDRWSLPPNSLGKNKNVLVQNYMAIIFIATDKPALLVQNQKEKYFEVHMRPWQTCRVSQGKLFIREFKSLHFEGLANALKFESIPKQICCCGVPKTLETG